MSALGPVSTPAVPGPAPTPAAARTAQAAFFRAALDGVAPARPRPAEHPAQTPPSRSPDAASQDTPARAGRPGALLDIRV